MCAELKEKLTENTFYNQGQSKYHSGTWENKLLERDAIANSLLTRNCAKDPSINRVEFSGKPLSLKIWNMDKQQFQNTPDQIYIVGVIKFKNKSWVFFMEKNLVLKKIKN